MGDYVYNIHNAFVMALEKLKFWPSDKSNNHELRSSLSILKSHICLTLGKMLTTYYLITFRGIQYANPAFVIRSLFRSKSACLHEPLSAPSSPLEISLMKK